LGIGQAFVTVLDEKGIPTETVVTHLAPPASFMGPLTDSEYKSQLDQSEFNKKYKDTVDPKSAFEILNERIQTIHEEQVQAKPQSQAKGRAEKSTFEQVLASPITKQVGKEIVRGVFGMLFGTPTRRRSRW
jgi:hypothetical protein